jgi:ABC-type multidrug transport system fused ATPase/permease subunit
MVLDRGRIAAQGRHDVLLRECALYARLAGELEASESPAPALLRRAL